VITAIDLLILALTTFVGTFPLSTRLVTKTISQTFLAMGLMTQTPRAFIWTYFFLFSSFSFSSSSSLLLLLSLVFRSELVMLRRVE